MDEEVLSIDKVYRYTLALAARADDYRQRALGAIHLLKYAYLADLAHAKRNDGATYTGTPWKFYHFGPWDADAQTRTALIEQAGATKRSIRSAHGEYERYELSPREADQVEAAVATDLPWSVRSALMGAVHEYGADTADLLRHVYLTPPMLAARPDEILDFTTAIEECEEPLFEADEPPPRVRRVRQTRAEKRLRAAAREATREKIQRLLAKRRAEDARAAARTPQPRYDDVFFAGLEAGDRAAGKGLKPSSGTLTFDDSVWSSSQRRDPDVS